MKKIKGQTWLEDIMCSATSASVVDQAEQYIDVMMRHHIRPEGDDDFNLRHPTEIAETVKQSTQTMEALRADAGDRSPAGRWRTRPRRAQTIPSRSRDPQSHRLGIGIGLGTLGARVIADSFHWPTRVSANAIALLDVEIGAARLPAGQ